MTEWTHRMSRTAGCGYDIAHTSGTGERLSGMTLDAAAELAQTLNAQCVSPAAGLEWLRQMRDSAQGSVVLDRLVDYDD